MTLFTEGIGRSPDLMRTWILLSLAWNDAKTAEKRSKQIDFIVDNLEPKRRVGFISILIMADSCYSTAHRRTKKIDGTLTFNLTVTLHVFRVPTYASNLSAH